MAICSAGVISSDVSSSIVEPNLFKFPPYFLLENLFTLKNTSPLSLSTISVIISFAVLVPIPSINNKIRCQLTASNGLKTTLKCAITSLTCAASINLKPPCFTKGILWFFNSISKSLESQPARNRTAMSFSGISSSLSSNTRWTINCDW